VITLTIPTLVYIFCHAVLAYFMINPSLFLFLFLYTSYLTANRVSILNPDSTPQTKTHPLRFNGDAFVYAIFPLITYHYSTALIRSLHISYNTIPVITYLASLTANSRLSYPPSPIPQTKTFLTLRCVDTLTVLLFYGLCGGALLYVLLTTIAAVILARTLRAKGYPSLFTSFWHSPFFGACLFMAEHTRVDVLSLPDKYHRLARRKYFHMLLLSMWSLVAVCLLVYDLFAKVGYC
jgi:hypothetical protein